MKAHEWQKTHWDDGEGNRVTIQDVLLKLEDEFVIPIRIEALMSMRTGVVLERERIDAADLSCPIIVAEKRGGFQYILDGHHRLQSAIEENKTHVLCRVLRGDIWM